VSKKNCLKTIYYHFSTQSKQQIFESAVRQSAESRSATILAETWLIRIVSGEERPLSGAESMRRLHRVHRWGTRGEAMSRRSVFQSWSALQLSLWISDRHRLHGETEFT